MFFYIHLHNVENFDYAYHNTAQDTNLKNDEVSFQ